MPWFKYQNRFFEFYFILLFFFGGGGDHDYGPERTAPMIILKDLSLFLITAYHRNVPVWVLKKVAPNRVPTPSIKVDDDGYQKKNPVLKYI